MLIFFEKQTSNIYQPTNWSGKKITKQNHNNNIPLKHE